MRRIATTVLQMQKFARSRMLFARAYHGASLHSRSIHETILSRKPLRARVIEVQTSGQELFQVRKSRSRWEVVDAALITY
jgi:hypothetical protein